jgi:hypothetical protein
MADESPIVSERKVKALVTDHPFRAGSSASNSGTRGLLAPARNVAGAEFSVPFVPCASADVREGNLQWQQEGVTMATYRLMRISFDVDDTLVLRGQNALSEPGRFPAFLHRWFGEPLRAGTCSLMRELRRRGCSVWIYTSSYRTPFYIHLWMFLHGIRIDGIVNDDRHRRELAGRRFSRLPSKYPPAFGIDLHVDDSEGVLMEGQEHGFRVIVVGPGDERWVERILDAVGHGMGPSS